MAGIELKFQAVSIAITSNPSSATMARIIHRLYNERAFRRERIIRDRSNPLDIYDDGELIMSFRFCKRDLLE